MQADLNGREKIGWKVILIFFIIATVLSNIFRFDVFELRPVLQQLPPWLFILLNVLLEGSGVLIGALVALFFLKKRRKRQISLFGTSRSKSLLMAAVPLTLLTFIGVTNDFGLDVHLYGFLAITGSLLYCVMEEYGWRGYLQEELRALPPWKKYITIGILWYLWHLSFLTEAGIGDNLFFLTMMILGSWGIGQVAELTRSIAASACFHLIIQIMMFNALIKNGISGTEKLLILIVSVGIWILILRIWKKENMIAEGSEPSIT